MLKLVAKLSRGGGGGTIQPTAYFPATDWGKSGKVFYVFFQLHPSAGRQGAALQKQHAAGQGWRGQGVLLRQPWWDEAGGCWCGHGASGGAGADSFMPMKYQPAAALGFPVGSFAILGSELGRAGCCRGAAELGGLCPPTSPPLTC